MNNLERLTLRTMWIAYAVTAIVLPWWLAHCGYSIAAVIVVMALGYCVGALTEVLRAGAADAGVSAAGKV